MDTRALTGIPKIFYDPSQSVLTFHVMTPEFQDLLLVLPVGEFSIGREVSCDHVIEDPTVSRLHCYVRVQGASLEVADNQSTHGIVINGEVAQRGYLKLNDRVELGDIEILVELVTLQSLQFNLNWRYPGEHRQPEPKASARIKSPQNSGMGTISGKSGRVRK